MRKIKGGGREGGRREGRVQKLIFFSSQDVPTSVVEREFWRLVSSIEDDVSSWMTHFLVVVTLVG